MISFQLELLGTFRATVDGEALPPLRSKKGSWLLALLALHHDRDLAREWLADHLWPDSPTDEGLTSLRQSLADLRHALGSEKHRLLSPTGRTLRLDLSGASLDLAEFDALVRIGDLPSLQRAVQIYRGPLLDGWSESWVLSARDDRQKAYLDALRTLAAAALAVGDGTGAAGWLRAAAGVDPLQQDVHRELMQLLAREGSEEAAIQVYHDLRHRLESLFGAAPDRETVELFHEVRRRARRRARPVPQTLPDTSPPCQIPAPLTGLIGREKEMTEVTARLITARLLTLTGTGGVGKTRLALEVARDLFEDYAGGAWFVPLAGVTEPALLSRELGARMGLQEKRGNPQQEVLESLVDFLERRTLLLLFDNCEHLLPGCAALIETLLSRCPGLRVLATSRERLGIPGESVYPVSPLALPPQNTPTEAEAAASPAVQLFLERATAVCPSLTMEAADMARAAEICRRLDGLPLAIELAAPLLEVLPISEIAARLKVRLSLADSSTIRPARHQTLRSMIDWSFDLLSPAEQRLFCRLSVFVGGWTLESAEVVCSEPGRSADALPLITRLVAKSMVMTDQKSVRYRMLETLREYAGERLQRSGEAARVRALHQAWFLGLALAADRAMTTASQQTWLERLDAEIDNLRAAIDTGREGGEAADESLRLAAALGRYWQVRGYFSEGRAHIQEALSRSPIGIDCAEARAEALLWLGVLAAYQGDFEPARQWCEEGLALARALGNPRSVAGALGAVALVAKDQGDLARARELFAESVRTAREAGDPTITASGLGYLGIVAEAQGDPRAARCFYEESLAIRRENGDRWGIAASMNNLGILACREGNFVLARSYLEASLTIRRELGDQRCATVTLNHLGSVALGEGDLASAGRCFRESLETSRAIGDRRSVAFCLEHLGRLAGAEENWLRSVQLYSAAELLRETIGSPLPPADQELRERELAGARSAIGEEACRAAWEAGRCVSLDRAIADAVGKTRDRE